VNALRVVFFFMKRKGVGVELELASRTSVFSTNQAKKTGRIQDIDNCDHVSVLYLLRQPHSSPPSFLLAVEFS